MRYCTDYLISLLIDPKFVKRRCTSTMFRATSMRSASRRFSTLAGQKKEKEADDHDFEEAHAKENNDDDKNDSNLNPKPPKTTFHHPSSSVHAASPLRRRARRATIMCHVDSDVGVPASQLRHAHDELAFKSSEMTRKISHRTHGGYSSTGAPPTRNMTSRINTANFDTAAAVAAATGLGEHPLHSGRRVTWYEALAYDGPGEHITPAEIHIAQASVLHSESVYVHEYAKNAKAMLTLHVARAERKEAHALREMRAVTRELHRGIQVQSWMADTVAAIVSKKERHSVKAHMTTQSLKKSGGKLSNEHATRRKKLLDAIYKRRLKRRQTLDEAFSYGTTILKKMERVLSTCTSRLAYSENLHVSVLQYLRRRIFCLFVFFSDSDSFLSFFFFYILIQKNTVVGVTAHVRSPLGKDIKS